jgi:hypothetical protein
MNKYLIDYTFNGKTYCTTIVAETWEEAEKKLRAIRADGKVAGEVKLTIPVPKFLQRLLNLVK